MARSLNPRTSPAIRGRTGIGQQPKTSATGGRPPGTFSNPPSRASNDAFKRTFGPAQERAGGTGGANVPNAPVQAAAVGGSGAIDLTWAAPTSDGGSAVIGYEIWRGTSSGAETLLTTVGAGTLTYHDVVAAGTKYYTIKARNAAGVSAFSNERSATAT